MVTFFRDLGKVSVFTIAELCLLEKDVFWLKGNSRYFSVCIAMKLTIYAITGTATIMPSQAVAGHLVFLKINF